MRLGLWLLFLAGGERHVCVETVVEPEHHFMRALGDRHTLGKCTGGYISHCDRARAEVEIIVFELDRPIARQRELHAGTDRPAGAISAAHLVERRGRRALLEMV